MGFGIPRTGDAAYQFGYNKFYNHYASKDTVNFPSESGLYVPGYIPLGIAASCGIDTDRNY